MPRTSFCLSVVFITLAILTGFRAWLFCERKSDLTDLRPAERLKLFWIGLRLDSVMLSRGALILIVFILVLPDASLQNIRPAFFAYAGILFFICWTAETAGVYYFRYYDFRPNYLVLEHGSDPEVFRTIIKAYPVLRILLVITIGTAGCLYLLGRVAPLDPGTSPDSKFTWSWDFFGTLLVFFLLSFTTRGTLGRRPINPSFASTTTNRVANEIAGSGIFNVLYEWQQQRKGRYATLKSTLRILPLDEATEQARQYVARHGRLTNDSPNPLVHEVQNRKIDHKLNVVLVIMESFTGRLVGALGGSPALTPALDRLAANGVLWESCYATGERTIQGLEAAVSSFPPLPGVGAARRPQARQGFSTLASILRERDYATLFLYGGQGIFDHMRAFFLGNGFDRFIEEKDFEDVVFRGAWGVSDEDLFHRADQEFRRLSGQGKPFFATMLTVSLHSPWEYPQGRIDPLPQGTRTPPGFEYEELNNFLYADYAVGRFIREAREAPYFDDTLFVFVGDHGVHLRGRDLIPVEEYRVPTLFLAPKYLRPKRISGVTSQLDIPPTIMRMLGGSYRSPFFGRDVFSNENDDGLAIMIYNKNRYGVISGSNLAVFAENGQELRYERSTNPESWSPAPSTASRMEQSHTAIALLQLAEHLLQTGRYTNLPRPAC
jgi:phosphoglycerol transferase MdoB-like AlkP superfamily enzyme